MSKLTFAIALLLASLFFNVNAAYNPLINSGDYPEVVVELTTDKSLQLEEEKLIRYKLRHQYTLRCGKINYGVINYTVNEMYRIRLILLSGQEMLVANRCSIERGQPIKSYYLKARE